MFGQRLAISCTPNARSAGGFSSTQIQYYESGSSLETTATSTEGTFFSRVDYFRIADNSGIESLAFWPQSEPRFKREPIWPAGRKRNADQTSSMATMDTERHPAALIASRITSRLRFPATFEVFFG
jgi:hypothetical protein